MIFRPLATAFMGNVDLELWDNKIFECYATEFNGPLWFKFISADCGGLRKEQALSRTGLETTCVILCQESGFIQPVI